MEKNVHYQRRIFFKEYHISENGLSEEQAASSLEKYGLNEVSQAKPKKWYNYFFGSLLLL